MSAGTSTERAGRGAWRRPSTPVVCRHPRARHEHGTYLCYQLDGCGCEECTRAARRQAKAYRMGIDLDPRRWLSARDLAELIAGLRASGYSYRDLSRLTGMGVSAIRRYAYRRQGRVLRSAVGPLLRVRPAGPVPDGASTGYVDATGPRRRLQALAAVGWPLRVQAERTGLTASALSRIRGGRVLVVRAATAELVRRAYQSMSRRPPVESQYPGASQVRAEARRRGWVPALCWEDEEARDDPAAVPDRAAARRLPRRTRRTA